MILMQKAGVFRNNELAGYLIKENQQSYIFRYDDVWFADITKPSISLNFPKIEQTYYSTHLFPFFFNMLSEGINKQVQCRNLKIDENDFFRLLLATAQSDTLGAITIQSLEA